MKHDLESIETVITDTTNEHELSDSLKKVIKIREEIFENKRNKIQKTLPILSFNSIGTIYKNSITIIQGKSGSHKSRFSETLIIELLKKNENILLVDTERNTKDHLPKVMQTLQAPFDLPFTEDLEGLDCISLIGTNRDKRIGTIEEYIALKDFKGVIVIDVVSDIVEDFNNTSDTQNFFDKANQLIRELDISFLFIIHENPSIHDKKARGHLGTESRNKASVTISISSMKEDKIKIEYLKTRHEKLPAPFYMCYDEATNLLKLCSIDNDDIEERIDNVIQSSYPRVSKDVLYKQIKDIINCEDARSVKKRIEKYFSMPFAYHGKEYILKEIGAGSKNREIVYEEYINTK